MSATSKNAPQGRIFDSRAEGLPPHRQRNTARPQTPRPRPPRKTPTLTPQEALQLLESAVSYCQQAGLQVYATNAIGGLRFYLPHAELIETADGGAAFRLLERAASDIERHSAAPNDERTET